MKDYLKYASYIVIAVTIAYVCATLKDLGTVGVTPDRVEMAADSAFLPIVRREFRPNPLSFGRAAKPVLKLPKGTREKDVVRTIAIINHTRADTTFIIETTSGGVAIPKKADSISAIVTNYLPAVVSFGLNVGVGLTFTIPDKFSPAASVSVLRWYGIVDAPVIVADARGLGIGIGTKLYHDIYVAPAIRWSYDALNKSIILNVSYQL